MTISEEDLRGLSAVEREALLATDADDEDVIRELGTGAGEKPAAPAAAPAPAEPDDDGEGEDDPPAAAPAPATDPAPEPAAAPAEPPPAADPEPAEPQAEEAPELSPLPQRSAPDDAAEQRKALRAEKNTAMTQLLAGEITQEAFQAIEDGVQDKLDALVRAESSDHAREQMRMDMMRGEYDKDLRAAQKVLSSAGLDLKAKDGAIAAEFDRAVRMFAGEAGARGLTDRPGDLAASREALNEAKELIMRRHGKATPAPAPAPTPAAAPPAPARSVAPPDRSKLPPTLANVPVASDATISNEFAHLDGLENAALERALARLTPEQQERYLG